MTQLGAWRASSDPAASGGAYLTTFDPAAALLLDFTGTFFEVIYVAGPGQGTFAVEIDGSVRRTVITDTPIATYDARATFDYLPDGPHTARLYPVSGSIAIDAFVTVLAIAEAQGFGDDLTTFSIEEPGASDDSILYICNDADDARTLCLSNAGGSIQISAADVSSHAWGPDGQIAFIDNSHRLQIASEVDGTWTVTDSCDASSAVVTTGDNASPPNTAINHGLEIVGWGPIGTYTTSSGLTIDIRCEEAMSNLVFTVQGASGTFDGTLSSTPVIELYESRPSNRNQVLVPYVVDFPGTTNGRTQRPIPRPFFCTRYSDPNGAIGPSFTPHSWYFYHLPSIVTVDAEQLYFPSQWTWTSGDN